MSAFFTFDWLTTVVRKDQREKEKNILQWVEIKGGIKCFQKELKAQELWETFPSCL